MLATSDILKRAKKAKDGAFTLTSEKKNEALREMAGALLENSDVILRTNKEDVESARGQISDVMLDRLSLTGKRIEDMASGILEVIELPDPVGNVLERIERNQMTIEKITQPLGVVGIIYESRPNVTSDAAALCLKSGNVCILRGGKEAFKTSYAIVAALKSALVKCGLDENLINIIEDTTRNSANEMMTAEGYIDLLIPRGGAGLINACVRNATVPCIQTGTGICHIYVDESADFDMALNIIENAKTSRPSVCNAAEVCLVNKKISGAFLPLLKKRLCDERKENPVKLILDKAAAAVIDGTPAGENDFDTEFLDYVLAVGVVDDVSAAVRHISEHSTHHSDAIITGNNDNAAYFTACVDSTSVYVNASTRFTDGGQFGLGCEMGISTQKLHARGPMGLKELTTYKYVVHGNGNIRG